MSALVQIIRTSAGRRSEVVLAAVVNVAGRHQPSAGFSSKDADSFYKVMKSKIRLDDETDYNSSEGGPNWELFSPRGNRFFLPGSLGPAWQGTSTTATCDGDIEKLIDFEEDDPRKLHISAKQCPVLLRTSLHELFPAPEVYNKGPLTMVTLTSRSADGFSMTETDAKKFVLAAREMCSRLRMHGYWADFMNPFSGKPFYSYASGKKLYKIDARFRGLGIRFEERDACLIIEPADQLPANVTAAATATATEGTATTATTSATAEEGVPSANVETPETMTASRPAAAATAIEPTMAPFTGNVFTTAPMSLTMLQALVVD